MINNIFIIRPATQICKEFQLGHLYMRIPQTPSLHGAFFWCKVIATIKQPSGTSVFSVANCLFVQVLLILHMNSLQPQELSWFELKQQQQRNFTILAEVNPHSFGSFLKFRFKAQGRGVRWWKSICFGYCPASSQILIAPASKEKKTSAWNSDLFDVRLEKVLS